MSADLEAHLREALRAWPRIIAAWLFGSAAVGTLRADSDVDVGVLGASGMSFDERAALAADLSRAAGRRCDVVAVESASPVLGMEIVSQGHRFHCLEQRAADAWEDRALRRYLGTASLRRFVNAEVAESLAGRRR
jgi:predicted nucleotidyltransferase